MAEPALVEPKHITLTGIFLIVLGILSMIAPVVAGTALIISRRNSLLSRHDITFTRISR
jgi:hypothetical protein